MSSDVTILVHMQPHGRIFKTSHPLKGLILEGVRVPSVATPTEVSAAVLEHPEGNAGVAVWRCFSQPEVFAVGEHLWVPQQGL